jgi:HSP20 family protein
MRNNYNEVYPSNWTSAWNNNPLNAMNTWNNPFNPWNSANTNENPLNAWNTAPFANNPAYTALTAFVNSTPNSPATNAYETTESYVFELAVPGYDKDSFEVSYSNNNNSLYSTLSIRTSSENRRENKNYSYREFNYSSFTREFNIPNNADTSETRAKYDNGVLTITIPKTETSNNWRTVKVG